MKIKIFDESHEKDLEEDISKFIEEKKPDIIDIKFSVSCSLYAFWFWSKCHFCGLLLYDRTEYGFCRCKRSGIWTDRSGCLFDDQKQRKDAARHAVASDRRYFDLSLLFKLHQQRNRCSRACCWLCLWHSAFIRFP